MIELHYWPTPHGWMISIMLEECGLPYRMVPVNIGRGEQFTPEFVALINPHHKMPAIVDDAPASGRSPLTITEGGAILVYLAEKAGQLLPSDAAGRLAVMQWLMWQTGGLGPMASQLSYFLQYATEKVPYALDRYGKQVHQLYGVLDSQLGRNGQYIATEAFSIADIAVFPWIRMHKAQRVDLGDYPHVRSWYDRIGARAGVQRGLALGRELRAPVLSQQAREALFGPARSSAAPR